MNDISKDNFDALKSKQDFEKRHIKVNTDFKNVLGKLKSQQDFQARFETEEINRKTAEQNCDDIQTRLLEEKTKVQSVQETLEIGANNLCEALVEIKKLERKLQDAEQENTNLSVQLRVKKEQAGDTTSVTARHTEAVAKIESLEIKVSKFRDKNVLLQTENQTLKQELSETKATADDLLNVVNRERHRAKRAAEFASLGVKRSRTSVGEASDFQPSPKRPKLATDRTIKQEENDDGDLIVFPHVKKVSPRVEIDLTGDD